MPVTECAAMRRLIAPLLAALMALPASAQPLPPQLTETSFWETEVLKGDLPPIELRLPDEPLVVDLPAKGRTYGQQGGTLRTMISRSKDVRQMVVYGYARLVGYNQDYELKPDILRDVEVDRIPEWHGAGVVDVDVDAVVVERVNNRRIVEYGLDAGPGRHRGACRGQIPTGCARGAIASQCQAGAAQAALGRDRCPR